MKFCTPADFELDERHVIKNEKVALDRLRVRQNVFLVVNKFIHHPELLPEIFINNKFFTFNDGIYKYNTRIKSNIHLYILT